MLQILLVEDDRTIASGLQYSLELEGYQVIYSETMSDALAKIEKQSNEIDLYLLDLSLPDGSGYELCKRMKALGDYPVIFLTAVDDEVNVVMGLDLGADDYITKPFRLRELISRMKSVLRRYNGQQGTTHEQQGASTSTHTMMELGPLRIHLAEGKVYKNGTEIVLTALEYRLLLIFANHRGQVLSRTQLLEQIWDVAGDFVNDNTLTVYIKRLREKIEDDPQQPKLIITIRGTGYRVGD